MHRPVINGFFVMLPVDPVYRKLFSFPGQTCPSDQDRNYPLGGGKYPQGFHIMNLPEIRISCRFWFYASIPEFCQGLPYETDLPLNDIDSSFGRLRVK